MRSSEKYMFVGGHLAKVKVTLCDIGPGTAVQIEAYDLGGKEVYLTASEAAEACRGVE
jgi:hypothetical protein